MTNYGNRKILDDALEIYFVSMREFIIRCLKTVSGEKLEDLIAYSLNDRQQEQFDRRIQQNGEEVEDAIDITYLWRIINDKHCWELAFKDRFDPNREVRSVVRLIGEARNRVAHREDIPLEDTKVYLFYIAKMLEYIKASDGKQKQVEDLQDKLPDSKTEHLERAEAEKVELKKCLEEAEADKVKLEKHLVAEEAEKTKLKGCLDVEKAGRTELKERLSAVKMDKDRFEKRLKSMLDQLELAKTEYEKRLKAASTELATAKVVNAKLEERLEITSTQLENVEAELTICKERLSHALDQLPDAEAEETGHEENFAEIKGHLPPNAPSPDSVTFQGTTFRKHLDKYHVTEDDISQNFWHYWHSQGREGKQEMREAGWSVEKVNGDWEVVISAENFQAWIEDEVSELSNLLNSSQSKQPSTQPPRSSYRKTFLPTGKDMEQPALEFLSDGREYPRIEIINVLTKHFSLTKNQREQLSRSGRVELYLRNKDLIERTRTGYYRITDLGLEVLRRGSH